MEFHEKTKIALHETPCSSEQIMRTIIDCVPQALQVACHHGDAQTNKPTKRDGRVGPLISSLHNPDKASGVPPIG